MELLANTTLNTEFEFTVPCETVQVPAVKAQLTEVKSLGPFLSSSVKLFALFANWFSAKSPPKQLTQGGVVVLVLKTPIEYKAATAITTIAIAIP